MQHRASGILLHPTSLPGKYGIGSLGNEAYAFVDFLVAAKQHYWQILPLGPTGYGDSPYQCFSSKAGNPYLIDLELLLANNLLAEEDLLTHPTFMDEEVLFGDVITWKLGVLKIAEQNFILRGEKTPFDEFIENNPWVKEYGLFMALKEKFNKRPWYEWEDDYRLHKEEVLDAATEELATEIHFQQFIQYIFFQQWYTLKKYANDHMLSIIGDIPIYVAMDSADTWANPELFQFDENKNPLCVGGCPPDYFSETGQLWGNPIFNYNKMKEDGFAWWIDRLRSNLELYDLIRVDHFRGFAGYWSIPSGEETAINGKWITGPGVELFDAIKNALGEIPIIAEDLGLITPDVIELRDHFNLPGMKILQFAFDSSEANDYIPHNYIKNCVVYTGTHDNDTIVGWFDKATNQDKEYVLNYLNSDGAHIAWDFIRAAWSSVANIAIAPMQDVLELGNEARMNFPGTTKNNWLWRMKADALNNELAEKLNNLTSVYGRVFK